MIEFCHFVALEREWYGNVKQTEAAVPADVHVGTAASFSSPDTVVGTLCAFPPLVWLISFYLQLYSLQSCLLNSASTRIASFLDKHDSFAAVWLRQRAQMGILTVRITCITFVHHWLMYKPLASCSLSVLIGTMCSSVLTELGLVQISLVVLQMKVRLD